MMYVSTINFTIGHYHILYFIYYVKLWATWRQMCSRIVLLKTSLIIVFAGLFIISNAQGLSNTHYTTFSLQSDTLQLDSMSVVPNTVVLRTTDGNIIDSSAYMLRAFQSQLIWKNKPAGDSIKIFFRTYPFNLSAEAFHKSNAAYRDASANSFVKPFTYIPDAEKFKLIDFGTLDYNGTFSRGLAFGTNQDVVLNSNFNLQLAGMLTKDLEITAAITDNSIPIQPEGNTQQIQEFDKIFIQLRKDQHKVIVGDFDLYNPSNEYFMKFSKKYQGGYYSGFYNVKKLGIVRTGVSGGISRGKFARNTLVVSEGNQGPYKLTGANGEVYLVILANSEEVFINGQKMERGADRDYVIDYNLGEITFTPRRIVTKDLRVVIEFEYSERNYLRSAAYVNTELETKKVDVRFNLFTEQDTKGQNVQQDLNAEKKTFLTTIGDSIQNALYRGFDSVAYDANRVLYRIVDTLGYDSIFVYSTDPVNAKYAVNFSFVGEGKGNYVPSASTANGRVYQWVQPFQDSLTPVPLPQGSYEPVILLVTPKYQQLYTVGSTYRINERNTVVADVAMSNTDVNMFSKKDNKDNLGFAGRVGYKGAFITKADSMNKRKETVNIDLNYEFLQDRFNTIERYRNVEFSRDWNLLINDKRYNEHLGIANISYNWSDLGSIGYRFKAFVQDTLYQGYENAISGNLTKGGMNSSFFASYLHSNTNLIKTDFIRPKADVSYAFSKIKGWRLGGQFDHEINMIKAKGADTLARNSYLWQNYKVYFTSPDSLRNKYTIEFIQRYEHRPVGNTFDKFYFGAQTVNFIGNINSFKNQTLNYTLTYRHAKDADSTVSGQPEHYYLGRVDYNFSVLKGVIRSTTLYEIGSGRQQKTQIVYQKSPTNQGDYIFTGDANENGVQDINEFQSKYYTDTASYVRLFIVTPEFISVNTNQFSQVINITPAAVWKNKGGIRSVISMFSIFASVQITKKTYADKNKKVGDYFNPFPLKREDANLVTTAISSRNSLYFNRLEAKYGAQFDFNYTQNRTLLTTGFENRLLRSQGVTVRWNIVKSLNLQGGYTNGIKANESDYYKNLTYRFDYNDAIADLSYQIKSFLRIGTKYEFSYKENPTDTVGKQIARIHKFTLEARYNRLGKSTIEASVSYASIQYRDKDYKNEQLEYAMLEGLRNGNNLIWNVGFEQNLTENIQLSITYDGRMTGFISGDKPSMKPVHTGRAEIRALF